MPDENLSPGEISRWLVRIDKTVTDLAGNVAGMLERLDERYQRRDLAEAEAANILARIQDVANDIIDVKHDLEEEHRQRVAERQAQVIGTRWGIGLALTAIGLVITATAALLAVLPGLVQP